MKYLLIPVAFAAANALACPADGAKDAMAPASSKPAVAAKATPSATVAATKSMTKVAAKAAAEPRKAAPL